MNIPLISTTTPGISATVELFNSVTLFGARNMMNMPLKRIAVNIFNDQTGTIRFHRSIDGGTTWRVFRSVAVAIPAANTINSYEQNLDIFRDVKVDFVNGATAQTTWEVDITGFESVGDRVGAVP
jgi:hypothetical protein